MKNILLTIAIILTLPFLVQAKSNPTTEIGFLTFPSDTEHPVLVRFGFKELQKPKERSSGGYINWNVSSPKLISRDKQSGDQKKEHKEWVVFDQQKKLGKLSSQSRLRSTKHHSLFYDFTGHSVTGTVSSSYKLKNPDNKFATSLGADKYRPLLLLNRTNFKDPENWKLDSNNDCSKEAINNFFKILHNYTFTETKTKQFFRQSPFKKSDIKVIACYINNKNKKLVGLHIPGHTLEPLTVKSKVYNIWYSNFQDSSMQYYASNLMPVAFGDFNNNGFSEWLFQQIGSSSNSHQGFNLRDNNNHHIYFVNWPLKK